jgi:glycosyl transferase family 87
LTRTLQWVSIALGLLILALVGYTTVRGDDPHHSLFGTYWASGRAALDGQNAYALYPETYRSDLRWCGGSASAPDLNLNPPATLPLFALLARMPMATFARVWTVLSVFGFLAGIALLCWQLELPPYQLLWLFAMTPTLNTISAGQIYALLFLLAAAACVLGRSARFRLAGIALGLLIAIKPTMAFFLPFLLLAGYWEAALYGAISFAAAWEFIPFFYPRAYPHWLAALHGDMHWIMPTDIAPIAVARRHGVAWLGFLLAALIFFALVAWIWRKRPSFTETCGIAACAGLLCAPLAWHTYILVAAPFFVARSWKRMEMIAAVLLVIPTPIAIIEGSTLYLIVIAMMLASFSRWQALQSDSSILDEMSVRS